MITNGAPRCRQFPRQQRSPRRRVRLGFLAGALALFAGPIQAEELVLKTTWPPPRAVYGNLEVTEETHLGTQGGNVGIGTSAPQTTLELVGALNVRAMEVPPARHLPTPT